jgi:hypothetical protein
MERSPPSMSSTGRLLGSVVDGNANWSVGVYARNGPHRDLFYSGSNGFAVGLDEMHGGPDRNTRNEKAAAHITLSTGTEQVLRHLRSYHT